VVVDVQHRPVRTGGDLLVERDLDVRRGALLTCTWPTTGPGLPARSLCTAIQPASTPLRSTFATVSVVPSPVWSTAERVPVAIAVPALAELLAEALVGGLLGVAVAVAVLLLLPLPHAARPSSSTAAAAVPMTVRDEGRTEIAVMRSSWFWVIGAGSLTMGRWRWVTWLPVTGSCPVARLPDRTGSPPVP